MVVVDGVVVGFVDCGFGCGGYLCGGEDWDVVVFCFDCCCWMFWFWVVCVVELGCVCCYCWVWIGGVGCVFCLLYFIVGFYCDCDVCVGCGYVVVGLV